MPVTGFNDKVVLDYGCGPGHDLIGFSIYSKTRRLIGVDVSASSLEEATIRLKLHDIDADLILLDAVTNVLPFKAESVDHIHSSGVLHHVPDPQAILEEFRRILTRNGTINIMVYNYDSLWLHLYVAYQKRILERKYCESDLRTAFSKTTDGENCPVATVYRPCEFQALAAKAGLECKFTGAAISMYEMSLLSLRYQAIMSPQLPKESRGFLLELKFDEFGYPFYRNSFAGVDGCYQLWKQ